MNPVFILENALQLNNRFWGINYDDFVKNPFFRFRVIPANTGIQLFWWVLDAGSVILDVIQDLHDTHKTFYEVINYKA